MITFAYECLRREYLALLEHCPAGEQVPTPGAIHRTRIAARRLRVALRMFRRLLPANAATLGTELKWFARALGEVRDLDVYASSLDAVTADLPGERTELERYTRHLHAARDAARASLPALFTDPRYLTLLESFERLVTAGPSRGAVRRWRSFRVCDGAHVYLQKSVKRILKRGNKVALGASADELHRLRIKAKRLRYALEFFADLYPSLPERAEAAKRLQDVLGAHQDACTASARVRAYMRARGGNGGELRTLLEKHEQQAAAAQRQFAVEWRRFKKKLSLADLPELLAA